MEPYLLRHVFLDTYLDDDPTSIDHHGWTINSLRIVRQATNNEIGKENVRILRYTYFIAGDTSMWPFCDTFTCL